MKKNYPFDGTESDALMDETDPVRLLIEREGLEELFGDDDKNPEKEEDKKE